MKEWKTSEILELNITETACGTNNNGHNGAAGGFGGHDHKHDNPGTIPDFRPDKNHNHGGCGGSDDFIDSLS